MTTEPKENHVDFRQSQEKSGESNSPGLKESDISMFAETCEAAEITGQSREKSGESNSPGLEDSKDC